MTENGIADAAISNPDTPPSFRQYLQLAVFVLLGGVSGIMIGIALMFGIALFTLLCYGPVELGTQGSLLFAALFSVSLGIAWRIALKYRPCRWTQRRKQRTAFVLGLAGGNVACILLAWGMAGVSFLIDVTMLNHP